MCIYTCVYNVYVCILGTDGMRLVSVRELCLLQANSELTSEPVKSDWNWFYCMQLKSTKRKITARLLAKSLPCGTPMEISIYMHLQSSSIIYIPSTIIWKHHNANALLLHSFLQINLHLESCGFIHDSHDPLQAFVLFCTHFSYRANCFRTRTNFGPNFGDSYWLLHVRCVKSISLGILYCSRFWRALTREYQSGWCPEDLRASLGCWWTRSTKIRQRSLPVRSVKKNEIL